MISCISYCRNRHHHFVQNLLNFPYGDYFGYWKLQLILESSPLSPGPVGKIYFYAVHLTQCPDSESFGYLYLDAVHLTEGPIL